jgi:bifunctional UDP-N-acetylglucosamine pyrophosphorylase/glucosamine-1-phosphate N-acetyltransferase|tara:strand:- start:1593 stop:2324 length:732 start_codon:yes stop_codon:yes gene_type:complete
MSMPIAAVVLAAGKGTRMGSDLHKVLHPLAGRPLLGRLLDTLDTLGVAKRVVVVGSGRYQITQAFPGLKMVVQEPQLGTAHAVRMAKITLADFKGTILVLYGDVPLVKTTTMRRLCAAVDSDHSLAVLGFHPQDTRTYGRLVTNADAELEAIAEHADATMAQREIGFCNSGIMAVRSDLLWPLLVAVGNDNRKGEYYLTDIVHLARTQGHRIATAVAAEGEDTGVNSQIELQVLEQILAEAVE